MKCKHNGQFPLVLVCVGVQKGRKGGGDDRQLLLLLSLFESLQLGAHQTWCHCNLPWQYLAKHLGRGRAASKGEWCGKTSYFSAPLLGLRSMRLVVHQLQAANLTAKGSVVFELPE